MSKPRILPRARCIAGIGALLAAMVPATLSAQNAGTHHGTHGGGARQASAADVEQGAHHHGGDDARHAERHASTPDGPEFLELPGMPGAWFYRPSSGGRQRVLMYLHPRNSDPEEGCRHWHEVTPRFGWLVCPIGQADRGGGRRAWNNNPEFAHRESIAALEALRARFPGRVRRHDNVIMGFSEGAYVGMQVGLMAPLTFPRWLIIAAHDRYIDGEETRIARGRNSVRRIFLLTGEHDQIVAHTRRADEILEHAYGARRVHMRILEDAGHQLPPDFRRTTRQILLWVTQ